MATLGSTDYKDALTGFMTGYDWADKVRQTRKTRQDEADALAKRKALAQRMAQGPAVSAIPAVPTVGGAAGITPATPPTAPTGGAIPATLTGATTPMPTNPTETPVTGPAGADNPEVQQLEGQLLQQSGREVMQQKDWQKFRDELMSAAGAIGDPAVVTQVDNYVKNLQQEGFKQNAAKAAVYSSAGNPKLAGRYLQKAFGYMEDGRTPRVQVLPDGNIMLIPVDEKSGAPAGNPMIMNPQSIGNLVRISQDPAEFAKWQTEFNQSAKEKKRTADTNQYNARTLRMQAEEKARSNKVSEKLKREEAAAKAKAKTTGEWNDTATRALTNDVARILAKRKEGAGQEVFDLYDANELGIQSDVVDIAKATENYNLQNIAKGVEKAYVYGYDIGTKDGEIVVRLPDGSFLPFYEFTQLTE